MVNVLIFERVFEGGGRGCVLLVDPIQFLFLLGLGFGA